MGRQFFWHSLVITNERGVRADKQNMNIHEYSFPFYSNRFYSILFQCIHIIPYYSICFHIIPYVSILFHIIPYYSVVSCVLPVTLCNAFKPAVWVAVQMMSSQVTSAFSSKTQQRRWHGEGKWLGMPESPTSTIESVTSTIGLLPTTVSDSIVILGVPMQRIADSIGMVGWVGMDQHGLGCSLNAFGGFWCTACRLKYCFRMFQKNRSLEFDAPRILNGLCGSP